jgi:hypothetical protein
LPSKIFIQECSCSGEEKEIMLLYAQFLLIKYKFRFRQELYNIDEFEAFDNGDKWLEQKQKEISRKIIPIQNTAPFWRVSQ